MAEFHEIGSSQFTDVTPTGEEKIQISASQRTTLQNIANLAPGKVVKQVVVTNFQTNTWKLRDGGSVSFPMDIKVGEIVTFTSARDAVKGPGVGLFGYAIKHNSLMASYVGMTTSNKVNGIPTIYTYKSAGAYATAWQQLPDASVKTFEITDFAIPGLNITKDGESFLFYANDASNIPNSNHGATSFVGVAIASPIFITGDQRLLYYMMVDTASGMFYTGRANLGDDVVVWNTTPITRLGQAVQVTAFTEPALSALLYSYKPGDFIPFYTSSVTASEANQFPESGIFNGFISMGRNEGDYFQIFAFKTGAGGKAYSGSCIGSTTTWTELGGGGGEQTVIWINANQNVFDVGLYHFTKLGEMFPIFIDTSAANNPSKEGYPCAGTVQCVGYQGPESWEAVFVVGSADEDQTPRGDYYKAHLSYDMGGSAWIELTTGSSNEIFPGWKRIVSSWSSAVGPSGTTGIIYFNQEIPTTSKMLIEATIQSSPATTATIKFPVPLTIAGINGTGQGVLFEICSKYLGINSTPGSIKLICSSVITGANGVRGMIVVVQSNNLSDASDIIQIKGIYFKA